MSSATARRWAAVNSRFVGGVYVLAVSDIGRTLTAAPKPPRPGFHSRARHLRRGRVTCGSPGPRNLVCHEPARGSRRDRRRTGRRRPGTHRGGAGRSARRRLRPDGGHAGLPADGRRRPAAGAPGRDGSGVRGRLPTPDDTIVMSAIPDGPVHPPVQTHRPRHAAPPTAVGAARVPEPPAPPAAPATSAARADRRHRTRVGARALAARRAHRIPPRAGPVAFRSRTPTGLRAERTRRGRWSVPRGSRRPRPYRRPPTAPPAPTPRSRRRSRHHRRPPDDARRDAGRRDRSRNRGRSVARNSAVMAAGSIVSRLTGFLRAAAISAALGAGAGRRRLPARDHPAEHGVRAARRRCARRA